PYDERTACELDTSSDHDCGPYFPPVIQGSGSRDPQVQTKIRDSDASGQWQITEYDAIPRDPETIAAFLATGADVWGSMDIGNNWLHVTGENVPDWSASDLDGGHAVVLAGYRHVGGQRQFLVHNSWGASWGDHGYAWVSEAMLKGFLRTAYKVVVAPRVARAAAAPGTPNALTDDDCGDDALVDAITGRCTKMCPGASRPSGGRCAR
ncbi:MAG: C1 family peptidase, partial [Polyangiaceae bacterium]